jgi:hypothetical protein
MGNKRMKHTKRFYCLVRVAIVLFILPLLLGCVARMTIKETPHYKVYENIVLQAPENFGIWTKTNKQPATSIRSI